MALTHRLKRLQAQREHLLERVIDSSDLERRRIAAEVHDGAVQDLIGITFSLSAAADEAPEPMHERLSGLAIATRHTVRSLRSLLNSIYPVQVPESGWAAGLDDIISALRQRGVTVGVDGTGRSTVARQRALVAPRRSRGLAQHRRPRPGFACRHHDAQERQCGGVADRRQRRRFRREMAASQRQVGHLGLQLLRDLSEDMGAVLIVDSIPGSGTTVHLKLEENR